MKIIITENKLFDNFQKLIDRELSKLRARYRSEEISASNWYLTIFSKIDSVKVTDIKNSPTFSVYINVYGDSRLDEDDVLTFANYLRKKLSVIGDPWIVPTLVGEINEMFDKTKDNVDKIKSLIDKKGLKKVITLMGGPDNLIKMVGRDGLAEYIYKYLDENWYPDYGWQSLIDYQHEVDEYGSVTFYVNDNLTFDYTKYENDYKKLDIHPILYDEMEGLFSIDDDDDEWVKLIGNWFEKNTGLKVDGVV